MACSTHFEDHDLCYGGEGGQLSLSLDNDSCERSAACVPRASVQCPVGCVQSPEPGAIFCEFESPSGAPPTVASECLFSKMKAQAETRAVRQNSLFFRFFQVSIFKA